MGAPLLSVCWNCNSWDAHKSQKIAALVATNHADVILITDARIDGWRLKTSVENFAGILQKSTGKIWDGVATPKHDLHRVGGNLIMYSNKITRPKFKHLMPLGVFSSLDGRWKDQDFSFLLVYRPPTDGTETSLRALVTSKIGKDMEEKLWDEIEEKVNLGPNLAMW